MIEKWIILNMKNKMWDENEINNANLQHAIKL
jgi:hypothetical protein